MNDGQEAFRRFTNQLRTVGGSGGRVPPGGKGVFAGTGLLVALVAGGFALNQSLFNGTWYLCIRPRLLIRNPTQSMVDIVLSNTAGNL